MSELNNNYIFKLSEFYRINFIGRPTELRKLVEDKYTFITSKKDANIVITSHRKYYGWQYCGNIFAFINYLFYIKLTKRYEFTRKKHFLFMTIGISPILIFYFYSHFTFWEELRPVVLKSREIANKLKKNVDEFESKGTSESYNKDEFIIMYNKNLDLHNYVLEKISLTDCLKEIIFLNKKLTD